MKSVHIIDTFKYCESNSFLASRLKKYFLLNNFDVSNDIEESEDIIICACGVDVNRQTNSKEIIDAAIKKNKRVIVTGCLPAINNQYFKENSIEFVPFSNIFEFDNIYKSKIPFSSISNNELHESFYFQNYGFSKAYYVHISSGCSNNCSYCGIKKAKGNVISKPISEIKEEIEIGLKKGYKDFVLLSDDCGSYGNDTNSTFSELITSLSSIKSKKMQLIIHYIFPTKLIELYNNVSANVFKKIKFINIPLQSGSRKVLTKMNRNYDPDNIIKITQEIKKINKDIELHTHFIYGYPDETREDFNKTLEYIPFFDRVLFFHYTRVNSNIKNEIELPYTEIMYRAFKILKKKSLYTNLYFGGYLKTDGESDFNQIFKIIKKDHQHQNVDVLLIFPKSNDNQIIGTPISLLSLCQPLIDNGLNIEILDERLDDNFSNKLKEIVNKNKLLCVGFTTFTGNSLNQIFESIKIIKETSSTTPVVLGGPYATIFSNELIINKSIDYIIKGEAENSFLHFILSLKKSEPANNVRGIVFKPLEGDIFSNNDTEYIDLNSHSFLPYYLLHDYNISYNKIFVQTSRGCPFNCKFCSIPILFGSKYRRLENNLIIELIEDSLLLTKTNTRLIFVDDNFFVNIKESVDLSKILISKFQNNLLPSFTWWAEIRADILMKFSKKELNLLKKSGLSQLFIGVESGSNETLKKINKNITVDTIIKSNLLLKKVDIQPEYSFVVGFPFENKDDYNATINLITKIKKENPKAQIWKLNKYVPFPGTPLSKEYPSNLNTEEYNSETFDFYAQEYDDFSNNKAFL